MELQIQEPRDEAELTTLVEQAKDGNARAFDQLALRIRTRVRRWAGRLTRDGDDAEDVAQLVLLRLHDRIGGFDGRSRFTSWLYRLTRNVALDQRRIAARRSVILAPVREANAARYEEEESAADEDTARIAKLIRPHFDALPARQREVFEMADLRGVPQAEIATRLGIAPATVRVLLFKARRSIRQKMLAAHPELLEGYLS
jgi:RNA polymerase sigma-70 factor (ECF subfamily)